MANPKSQFTSLGFVFMLLCGVVPAYGLFDAVGANQAAYRSSVLEASHIDWATANQAPVKSDEAMARVQRCALASDPEGGIAPTVFNRNFSFDDPDTGEFSPEIAEFNEGRFFCGLDGSTVQIIGGAPSNPVKVAPAQLGEYHQALIRVHNVPVEQIINLGELND